MAKRHLHLFFGVLSAVLLSSCKETAPPSDSSIDDPVSADEPPAYTHTKKILSFGPRPPGSAGLKKSRDYVSATLTKQGWHVAAQTFTAPTPRGEVTFINLIARFGKQDQQLWSKPVAGLIGAHLDSKFMPPPNRFVGADDAASSVGVILELARTLAETPAQAEQIELVFFDGEEAFGTHMTARDGIYGSRAYAQRWLKSPPKPQWGLILDMIGHRDLAISLPSDSPTHLVTRLRAAAKSENASDIYTIAKGPILDDHVPLNNAGIPTLDIIGDFTRTKWWHTNDDNLANLSQDSIALSQRVTTRLVQDLLANPPKAEGRDRSPSGP